MVLGLVLWRSDCVCAFMMCCVCTIMLCCGFEMCSVCIVVFCMVQSDLNSWNVGSVMSMKKMFYSAKNFNVCFPVICLFGC